MFLNVQYIHTPRLVMKYAYSVMYVHEPYTVTKIKKLPIPVFKDIFRHARGLVIVTIARSVFFQELFMFKIGFKSACGGMLGLLYR